MLPFSKRPPPPEEYFLRSGDFEAHRQDSYPGSPVASYASPAIPPAPRAPVFARQASQTPYGFAQNQQTQYGSGQYGSLSSAPAPHSLAPMAMSPDSTGRNFAYTSSRSNGTVVVREKPSLKWGVMIALTGALLGGVLGLGMDARRQNARAAAAAADARDNAPPAMVAAALPNALTATPRPAVPAAAVAVPAAGGLPANVIAPPGAVVLAGAAPLVVGPKTADIAPKTAHAAAAVKAPAPKSHFLAAKVQTPKAAPEKAEKADKADAPEPKTAKADAPEPKKPAAKKELTTAQQILEAANKDTTNTL